MASVARSKRHKQPAQAPRRIEDYAMIGDCHSASLVAREGSVNWLCIPRFDAYACFASLLGNERAQNAGQLALSDRMNRVVGVKEHNKICRFTIPDDVLTQIGKIDLAPNPRRKGCAIGVAHAAEGIVEG